MARCSFAYCRRENKAGNSAQGGVLSAPRYQVGTRILPAVPALDIQNKKVLALSSPDRSILNFARYVTHQSLQGRRQHGRRPASHGGRNVERARPPGVLIVEAHLGRHSEFASHVIRRSRVFPRTFLGEGGSVAYDSRRLSLGGRSAPRSPAAEHTINTQL